MQIDTNAYPNFLADDVKLYLEQTGFELDIDDDTGQTETLEGAKMVSAQAPVRPVALVKVASVESTDIDLGARMLCDRVTVSILLCVGGIDLNARYREAWAMSHHIRALLSGRPVNHANMSKAWIMPGDIYEEYRDEELQLLVMQITVTIEVETLLDASFLMDTSYVIN